MKMPRKTFRGKSMRPDKGVVVDTETIVKYRKKTRPGKRMLFGSIRAQKAGKEKRTAEEVRQLRQKNLDDYVLVQKRIEDFKRYPKKKNRKEKSLEQKKVEEAAEESLPYRVKKKMKEAFPVPAEKIGEMEVYHRTDEMVAKAYDEALKKKEEIKKGAKKTALINVGTGNSPQMMKFVLFLIGMIILLGLIAWLASRF